MSVVPASADEEGSDKSADPTASSQRMDITGGILLKSATSSQARKAKESKSLKLSPQERYEALLGRVTGSANHEAHVMSKGSDSGAAHVLERINRSSKYHGSQYTSGGAALESESKDNDPDEIRGLIVLQFLFVMNVFT